MAKMSEIQNIPVRHNETSNAKLPEAGSFDHFAMSNFRPKIAAKKQ